MDTVTYKRQILLNENLTVQACDTSPQAIGHGASGFSKTTQDIAIALGHPPQLHGKTQQQKVPHTLAAEQRKVNLRLTMELLPCWLPFLATGCTAGSQGRLL